MLIGSGAVASDYSDDLIKMSGEITVDRRNYDTNGMFDCAYYFATNPKEEYCDVYTLNNCDTDSDCTTKNPRMIDR